MEVHISTMMRLNKGSLVLVEVVVGDEVEAIAILEKGMRRKGCLAVETIGSLWLQVILPDYTLVSVS